MKPKNITNIANGQAEIRIYDHIGYDPSLGMGVSGSYFADLIQALNGNPDVSKINVRINSPGGAVSDGYSIVSSILNSAKPVDTYIDGMAYSMAGVVATCGRRAYMADYGTFMMHEAQGDSDKKVLDLISNSLSVIFQNRTGKTPENVADMMKCETWLNAHQARENGFVDEILPTNQKFSPSKNASPIQLHAFYNSILNKKTKQMTNVTTLLKLSNDASEESIAAAVQGVQKEATDLAAELAAVKAENEALKAAALLVEEAKKASEKAEADALITAAITDGKVSESAKESLEQLAVSNFVAFKNTLSAISPKSSHPGKIFNAANAKTSIIGGEKAAWTIRDWEKKDPSGLLKIKNETPEIYTELFNSFYKKSN